ncbi:MAG: hypothetical protein M3N38_08930 [Pseudomonadota bacterium]|nr:hypothetical protein [Pseudomonadota bacterium]
MNVVLRIAGILLSALGLLVVLLVFYSPELAVPGVDLDIGVSVLLGGIIVLGLSSIVAAVEDLRSSIGGENLGLPAAVDGRRTPIESPATADIPALGAAPEKTLAVVPDVSRNRIPPGPPVDQRRASFDTGKGLEAKLQSMDEESRSAIDRVVEEVREHGNSASGESEVVSEENLYVIEEREIAGKHARVLSDGTVEAETDEGWMRFENPEHLEEYMAAVNLNVGRG